MVRKAKPLAAIAFLLAVGATAGGAGLAAQTPTRPWNVTAAFGALRVGGATNWVYGPEVGLRRDIGPHWGVGLRAALPVLDTAPYSDDGAVALDLGATLNYPVGQHTEAGLAAGATAFLVADAGELTDGGIGVFADAHATRWMTPALGITAGATVRIAGSGTAYPSLSGGLALRF